jgi:hypothetical protein
MHLVERCNQRLLWNEPSCLHTALVGACFQSVQLADDSAAMAVAVAIAMIMAIN